MLHELGYRVDAVPWLLWQEILTFRSYARSREAVTAAEARDETLDGESADLVRLIRARVQRARLGLLPE